LPFFGQNCTLPFSFRLDIPALLKSWQKHYLREYRIYKTDNFIKLLTCNE
jgi:hypothetical protein